MPRLTNLIAAAALVFLGTALSAQDGGLFETPAHPIGSLSAGEQTTGNESKASQKATFTGCLTKETFTVGGLTGLEKKGASEEYKLQRDTGENQQITIKGPAALLDHIDHRVQLSGTMSREDGKEVFRASEVKHLAESCHPGSE